MKNALVESPPHEQKKHEKLKSWGASFNSKILRLFIIVIILIILLSLFFFITEYQKTAKSNKIVLYQSIMESILSQINNWTESKTQMLKSLQISVVNWEQKPEIYFSLFKQILETDKSILSLYFVNANSSQLGGYKIDGNNLVILKVNNLHKSQWYLDAVFSQKKIISEPFYYNRAKKIAVTIAYPVIKENKVLGVVAIDCDLSNIIKFLNDNSIAQRISFYLIAYDGRYINNVDTVKNFNRAETLFNQKVFDLEKSFITNQETHVKFIDKSNIFYLSHKLSELPLILFIYGNISSMYDTVLSNTFNIAIRIVILTIALIFVFSFILSTLTKHLTPMVLKIKSLAEGSGDLSERITSKAKDEIGMLAHYFNEFLNYFNSKFIDLKSQAEKMLDSQESVAASVHETSASVHEISASLNQINENVQNQNTQINDSVKSVSKLITGFQTLSEILFSQSTLIEQSSASIQELTKSMDTVAKHSSNAKQISNELKSTSQLNEKNVQLLFDQIQKVHNYSKQIIDIVKIINEVAEKTDLLAMNAAIEAAHAGDKGSGFALVAEEIRSLSETVSFQSNEIKTIVEQVSSEINLSVQTSSETIQSLKKVIEEISKNNIIVTQISEATIEQSKGGKEILHSIRTLNEITSQINSVVGTESKEIHSINKVNSDLVSFTHEITDSINQQTSALHYINTAMADIVNQMNSLKSTTSIITSFIEKFKTK